MGTGLGVGPCREASGRGFSAGTKGNPVLNKALAKLLCQQGLEARAEQSLTDRGGRIHRADAVVELDEQCAVIETEFAQPTAIRQGTFTRIREVPLVWRCLPVRHVFNVVFPSRFRNLASSDVSGHLARCEDLEFSRIPHSAAESASFVQSPRRLRQVPEIRQTGPVGAFAEILHAFWAKTANSASVEETVSKVALAIDSASALLANRVCGAESGGNRDSAAIHALIWLSALLFQDLLSVHLDTNTLPATHRNKPIPAPDSLGRPSVISEQWDSLLEINWWPIFAAAQESLGQTPSYWTGIALPRLRNVARSIAESGVIRRHDIAGRIFHRLLDSRKFLATNYTTIPAGVILAGLALDRGHRLWKNLAWSSPDEVANLRIVDPACGSGTLLMAVVREVLKHHRRAGGEEESRGAIVKALLEKALHGFDVVPLAVHLTATTLSMAETRQAIADMPIYWMPHDVSGGSPRLGSLDFLASSPSGGKAQCMELFPDRESTPRRVTGVGEQVQEAIMPEQCDLVIANPPYTRAGGPGSVENTDWNPLFGSVLSRTDADVMQKALRKTLDPTPASLYAGLGSAFTVLAHERLKQGGRLALILPATALTGSSWTRIREMLLRNYRIDWIVVSHDPRHRSKAKNLPGRLFVGFSESTRIAETLIVATKAGPSIPRDGLVCFVNLRRNPDEPIEAIGLVQALLAEGQPDAGAASHEIVLGAGIWGEVCFARQSDLNSESWPHVALIQGWIINFALALRDCGTFQIDGVSKAIPIGVLYDICDLGPYEMQIKNPKQGLFHIVETDDPTRQGHPALWHHKSSRIVSLATAPNARLREREDRDSLKQEAMLRLQGHLHVARELRHAPRRLGAVLTSKPSLGVRSWITLLPKRPAPGKEEALCLWMNSTPGLALRIVFGNRPYLGRSVVHHKLLRNLPTLDVDELSEAQLAAASQVFDELKHKELTGFAHIATDPVRRELDRRLFDEVLGLDVGTTLDDLALALNNEPTLIARH